MSFLDDYAHDFVTVFQLEFFYFLVMPKASVMVLVFVMFGLCLSCPGGYTAGIMFCPQGLLRATKLLYIGAKYSLLITFQQYRHIQSFITK